MFKTRYTITTTGSRSVVRRVGPCSYPIARATSPGNIEETAPRKSSPRRRRKKKR